MATGQQRAARWCADSLAPRPCDKFRYNFTPNLLQVYLLVMMEGKDETVLVGHTVTALLFPVQFLCAVRFSKKTGGLLLFISFWFPCWFFLF
jgi:hypothetical protein